MEHSTYCSAEITDLARAMLKVQADLQPALKDRENTFSIHATRRSTRSWRPAGMRSSVTVSGSPNTRYRWTPDTWGS